jgi:uncharacterized membrane protein YbhN (UPF0104 family)
VRTEPGAGASSPARGRLLRAIPLLISIVSIGWVVLALATHAQDLPATAPAGISRGVALGAPAYAALTILPAIAWWWLLGAYEPRPAAAVGYALWARTQIAKYLPGNVFHVAGRHAGGRSLGLSHQGLAAALVFETGSTVVAALAIGAAAAIAGPAPGLPPPWIVAPAALAAVLSWPLIDRGLRRFRLTKSGMRSLPPLSLARSLRLLVPANLVHIAFFLGSGTILWLLIRAGEAGREASAVAVLSAYALAWLAGTLIPGAPGGLGVREAVIVLLLSPAAGAAAAGAGALALRMVTLAGDVITSLLGLWVGRANGR